MSKDDILWKLDGAIDIEKQDALYELMKKSSHLKDLIYRPDELKQAGIGPEAHIRGKRFERVSFSKTYISGIIFRDCIFHQCQFIGTTITNCEFHNCSFISTNTYKVSISRTYIDPLSFNECLDKKKYQNIGIHLYRVLLKNSRDEDQIEFERDSQFLFLRWKRYQDGYEVSKLWKDMKEYAHTTKLICKSVSYIRRWGWEILLGSGVRIKHFVWTTLGVTLLFSSLNFCFREEFGLVRDDIPITNFIEAVYFTTISLTTLGYGDLVPTTNCGRLFAAIQSIVGFCLFAVLASMLFRRASP